MIKKFLILFNMLFCVAANGAQFQTNAKSVYLFDYDSGAVIVEKNADKFSKAIEKIRFIKLRNLLESFNKKTNSYI